MTSTEADIDSDSSGSWKQGDHTAMETVYSTHIRYLTAVCSRYILNAEDVKDVLQDSFLKIFSNIVVRAPRQRLAERMDDKNRGKRIT